MNNDDIYKMNESPYKITVSTQNNLQLLSKSTWLVILHAARIPPHVGILVDGSYNSLTIKGHELGIKWEVLLKTIQQKKIETLCIELIKHPVFSANYQLEIIQHHIQQFTQVNKKDTCLSPVKLFLQEFYVIPFDDRELLFELVERLKQNNYIQQTIGINVEQKLAKHEFTLPIYTTQQLQQVITTERANYYKD